jgi:hypothetical protein
MSKSIFSPEVGSKVVPTLPEPAPKAPIAPASDVYLGPGWAHANSAAASAEVAALDKLDPIVIVSPEPYRGPTHDNGHDASGNPVHVPVIPPGQCSKQEVKLGAAGRVRMPSGAIINAGGELLNLALRNGGVLLTE